MFASLVALAACSGTETQQSTSTGGTSVTSPASSGGTTSARTTGGAGGSTVIATGGNATAGSVSGGTTGNAGTTATGGTRMTGGATSAGGVTSMGGSAMGGASASGGKATTGGMVSTGGVGAVGGSSSSGGKAATGGLAATGGSAAGTYHPCPTDGTVCKIMPFGDSITDGYNSDTQGGYRVQLFHLALAAGKNITFVGSGWNGPDTVDGVAFPHNHEGHSGWSIYPYNNRLGISECLTNTGLCGTTTQNPSVLTTYAPHIVLLMIGTNDCIDNYDLTNAPTRLNNLIATIYTQLPNVFLVVAQPIPSRGDATQGDDTGLSDRLKTYGSAIPAVVNSYANAGNHIRIVDMFTPFDITNKISLFEDQWHPNAAGYVILGNQWYSVLQSVL